MAKILTNSKGKIIIAVISLLIITYTTLWSEIVILKDGKVFEGGIVEENDDKIELKTEYGVLTFDKSNIEQRAKDVEELLEPADKLREEAKTCYERALKLREKPKAKNKELLKGKNLLYESYQVYDRIRQMFPQEKYAWIDQKKKEILDLIKEFRCARVRESTKKTEPTSSPSTSPTKKTETISPPSTKKIEPPLPPPKPPKPLTLDELIALLESGTAEEKLKAIEKLAESPKDKAIQPLVNEFVKKDQDLEVYVSIKSVLPKFNSQKAVPLISRIAKAKKRANISSKVQNDALVLLSEIGDKKAVKTLVTLFLRQAKFMSKARSIEEKVKTRKETERIGQLITKCAEKETSIPLLSKYLSPKTESKFRKIVTTLIVDIDTEKSAEALVCQLRSGIQSKDILPVMNGLIEIGLPTVFMPLFKALDNQGLKTWAKKTLYRLTSQTFSAGEKEKWLEWWAENKDKSKAEFEKMKAEESDEPVTGPCGD